MSDAPESDRGVLKAIRRGDAEAWFRFIDEYQGRLLRFALARVAQSADAEDIVQETFTSFIRVVNTLQIRVSLETYLFGILRHEIVNRFRNRRAQAVCLIQDVYRTGTDDASLVRATGGRVKLVPGTPLNFKVTTAMDLALAEYVIRGGLA